ncbi:glycosyltransferase [uncultured Ilyobacter sp.]|uniref:glycosyltransferase n=1 Tax=uncultured Ilyobacter sp. TaxID=544433 RepID=UPI002AA8A45A|nr:glycosyltransferase [uncultured Ilyobacter sp.]
MKKILYIVNGNLIKGTGFSQRIKRQMETITQISDVDIDVVNSVSIRDLTKNYKLLTNTRKIYEQMNLRHIFFYLDFPLKIFKLFPNLFFRIKAKRIKRLVKRRKYDLVYCENLREAYTAYLSKKNGANIEYILDYHGVVPEEFRDFGDGAIGKFNYDYLKMMEKATIQSAKKIVCVSESFKSYIVKMYNFDDKNIFVVPSCVPKSYVKYDKKIRFKLRNNLGISDRKVIVYAGSAATYQCIEEMIELFGEIIKYDSSFYFLFLVAGTSRSIIRNKFEHLNINDSYFRIDSVDHELISDYLMASDYGMIIRNNSLVNVVASPTKILEYLSTGLPIIMTNNIGDFSNTPNQKCILDYDKLKKKEINASEVIDILNKVNRDYNFEVCKELITDKYTWEKYLGVYEKLINS